MRSVSRYSDSITSINNLSIKQSTESLNKNSSSSSSSSSSPKSTHKPLLSKQKRRSKVKSLFFPLSPKEKLQRTSTTSSTQDLRNIEPAQRSLSLNNVRYSVSLSKENLDSKVSISPRVSVTSSKSNNVETTLNLEN